MKNSALIFCEVYSDQIDTPILREVHKLSDVLQIIKELPNNIFMDLFIDVYDPNNPICQETYSALGQSSKEDVIRFVEHVWSLFL